MGTLRFLLALAVVWGHSGSSGMLNPYYCVQAFFVISGFYMALIHEKYAGRIWLFYFNRYSRLLVPYWIVLLVTFIAWSATHKFPVSPIAEMPTLSAFANVAIFGLDLVQFFGHTGWLFIPQGWSLGTELLFYALVPFLVLLSSRTMILVVAATFVLRVLIAGSELPFFPWQQRFFPVELGMFLVGILAYRSTTEKRFGLVAMIACAAVVLFIGQLGGDHLHYLGTMAIAAILYFAVPRIFATTRAWRADRFLGEFSYPIYLWHIFVLSYIGENVLLLTVTLAVPMVLWVEIPLEKWRASLLRQGRFQLGKVSRA